MSETTIEKVPEPSEDKEKVQDSCAILNEKDFNSTSPTSEENKLPRNPVETANILSRWTYWWMNPIFAKGAKQPLEINDLYQPPDCLKATESTVTFEKYWTDEKSKASDTYEPSVSRAIKNMVFFELLGVGFLKLIGDVATTFSPLVLRYFIQYVNRSSTESTTLEEGFLYVLLMFGLAMINTVFFNRFFQRAQLIGLKVQTVTSSLVYRKSLKLSSAARQDFNAGKVTNVVSTDTQRIFMFMMFSNILWLAPVQILLILGLMISQIGPAALAGVLLLIALTPVNAILYKKLSNIRKDIAPITDQRVKLTNEVLSGIRIIKLFSWEDSFLKKLEAIRNSELKQVLKRSVLNALTVSIVFGIPIFCSTLSFMIYGLQNVLQPEEIFPTLTLFGQLRFPLMFLPNVIVALAEYKVACGRITQLLMASELESQPDFITDDEFAIKIQDGEFKWDAPPPPELVKESESSGKLAKKKSTKKKSDEKTTDAKKVEPIELLGKDEKGTRIESSSPSSATAPEVSTLRNINLKIPHGKLVAVVGKVGSGKSSLLNAMIGEMKKVNGSVSFSGTIGFAPQMAWIQNETLQNNIQFGLPMDRYKYIKAIRDCSLERDLEVLPDGDQTQIGERGINLSGGQKQRVNLARCVYYDSSIVLMDDPLSAVDAHVGRALFENCILESLKGKTRVLVTHQLHFLPKVDFVIVLDKGQIVESGTYNELMAVQNGTFAALMNSYGGVEDDSSSTPTDSLKDEEIAVIDNINVEKKKQKCKDAKRIYEQLNKAGDKPVNELMTKEERQVGTVQGAVWLAYVRAGGGFWFVSLFIFALLVSNGARLGNEFWLVVWTENRIPAFSQREYISVFWIWGIFQVISLFSLGVIVAFAAVRAARNLHANAAKRILRTPVSFFDSTPLGRIINRFSKDFDSIDNLISEAIRMFMMTLFSAFTSFILIIYATPYFAIPLVPLLLLYYYMQQIYRSTSRELKRLDSVARSPLYAHFSESLTGLSTIRAYHEEERFIKVVDEKLDGTNTPNFLLLTAQRWLAFRLESIGAIIVFFAATFGVLARYNISPSVLGLSLSYAIQISGILSWCVRQFAETEVAMNAVERVDYYGKDLEVEAEPIIEGNRPPPGWPKMGNISIEKLDIRYKSDLPLVLQDVTAHITDKQKVGVVGRTGSGKSTLMNAIFRIMEPSGGSIIIDGIDICKIGLSDLRRGLAIIPQDPVLFEGSFRSNLDPFNDYTDIEIWDALERANLKQKVVDSEKGLEAPIQEGGENLSVGERQLVCLGRAMLKKPKILVMDEATANVDLETDGLIQRSIREDFKDATILTIAHRLNTIIDYDMVIVFDKGHVVEIGPPGDLLRKEEGYFSSMVNETGATNAEMLKGQAFGTTKVSDK